MILTLKRIPDPSYRPRRYSITGDAIGYVGDVFKVGGWKGRACQGYWVFEDTELRQFLVGSTWRVMIRRLPKIIAATKIT